MFATHIYHLDTGVLLGTYLSSTSVLELFRRRYVDGEGGIVVQLTDHTRIALYHRLNDEYAVAANLYLKQRDVYDDGRFVYKIQLVYTDEQGAADLANTKDFITAPKLKP